MTIEVLTKFDPFAMVAPKNQADINVLLDEALYELANINAHLDEAFPDLGATNDNP